MLLQVGVADQLAFFLPGVVSQIGKVLHVSKTMISGAAGSMEAMDQALRGLTEFLMIVLQDDANLSSLDDSEINLNTEKSSLSFLEELRRLPGKKEDQVDILVTKSTQKSSQSEDNRSLHVDRTRDWIATASSHVNKILSAVIPHVSASSHLIHTFTITMIFIPEFLKFISYVLALCSSSKEGQTGDHGCNTGTLVNMQPYTERKQTNASCKFKI